MRPQGKNKAKQYQKRGRGGAGRHVQLAEWLQSCPAWATLKPGPRVLYIELKRRFNGSNNGDIHLSHRDAAKALNISRNTVAGFFETLAERGFITMTTGPHLGPSGIGQASKWALTEEPLPPAKLATKAFLTWAGKTESRRKN